MTKEEIIKKAKEFLDKPLRFYSCKTCVLCSYGYDFCTIYSDMSSCEETFKNFIKANDNPEPSQKEKSTMGFYAGEISIAQSMINNSKYDCTHCPIKGNCPGVGILKCKENLEKFISEKEKIITGQLAKSDKGKLQLTLVPTQIVKDIAEVREYGVKKYGEFENWKSVEKERYFNAMYRHWLEFLNDPTSIDAESGIAHYKHCACNMAFICEMMKAGNKT